MDNCTFYADYTDGLNGVNADFSVGSPQATFTRTCSATNPATYIDASGVIQLVTTNNAPRYSQGYYDTTGFHAVTGGGLLVEASKANLLIRTDGTASGAGLWTGWTNNSNTTTTPTLENNAITELTSISSAKSQKITYVSNVADAAKSLNLTATVTGDASLANGDVITVSFWIRGSTQENVTVYIQTQSAVPASLNTNLMGTITAASITASWTRVSFTYTIVDATTDRGVISIRNAGNVDAGDAIWWEIYGVQLEKSPYPTSFIPTTSAALTRNADTLKFKALGNRTSATESIFIKYTNESLESETLTYDLLDTDSKRRTILLRAVDDSLRFRPNETDSVACDTTEPSVYDPNYVRNQSYVVTAVCQTGVNPYASLYLNGTLRASETGVDYTAIDFSSLIFYIGSSNDATSATTYRLDGLIQKVAIFSDAKAQANVTLITANLNA
jgi:hypothetical protein